MTLWNSIKEVASFVGIAIGLIAFIWVVWKRAVFDLQEKTIVTQSETIDAYEQRFAQLEKDIAKLQAGREEDRKQIAHMNGVIEGKELAMIDFVRAVSTSDICVLAPKCKQRVIPVPEIDHYTGTRKRKTEKGLS